EPEVQADVGGPAAQGRGGGREGEGEGGARGDGADVGGVAGGDLDAVPGQAAPEEAVAAGGHDLDDLGEALDVGGGVPDVGLDEVDLAGGVVGQGGAWVVADLLGVGA